jgi:hypothetical protein
MTDELTPKERYTIFLIMRDACFEAQKKIHELKGKRSFYEREEEGTFLGLQLLTMDANSRMDAIRERELS